MRPVVRPVVRPIARAVAGVLGGGGGIAPPGAPTIGTATAGNAQASVTFTAPGSTGGGPITGYRVTSTPGGITATGAGSPITVTGLTNGVAYTFTVAAQNAGGFGPESAASNSVTPSAVTLNLTGRNEPPGAETSMGYRVRRDGVLQNLFSGIPGPTVSGQWVSSGATATIGDAYEVRLDAGAWQQLNVDRDLSNGLLSFTIEIRPFGGGATLASATYTFNP